MVSWMEIEEVLMDVRPYIEYYGRLKELVERIAKEASSIDDLIARLKAEEERTEEPFKTDLRILINKLESLR
ncbi:hypothetical protein [Pyrococcus abyssi]|uniref:Uncharacterized protein n=1 Tax=Pyrococcus abyssi (strain GE5 / Orsay) TaxID=272844 RepID=G8ZFQ5_PYRAB|nr:hypothetical protein [Pyrococcus abyssi]CCE69446.1 TPA: hypothetical protein PAB0037.1n [Pyrococcus abyssi GE5]